MTDWLSLAACKGHPNPEIFFPASSGAGNSAEAKKVCAECPVTKECLEYALSFTDPAVSHGVWGGVAIGSQERTLTRRRTRYRSREVA